MSNSRVLASSGGDHPTLADWEAFVSDAANYNGTDWDDTVEGHGGDQVLRVANESFGPASANVIDVDALATATYFKVTVRPNTEGGVTPVGEQHDAALAVDPDAILTPRIWVDANHQFSFDISGSPNVEWHIEDIVIGAFTSSSGSGGRRPGLKFATTHSKNVYIDRCHLITNAASTGSTFSGGPTNTAVGRVHLRSCLISTVGSGTSVQWQDTSGAYILGCTWKYSGSGGATTSSVFDTVANQLSVLVYGNALVWPTDGSTGVTGTNIAGASFDTDFNVANVTGANWTSDFAGSGDVSNSTVAAMFVGSADYNPKSAGPLDGGITWSSLPSDVQNAWPDTDFFGQTITKSGTLTVGAIQLAVSGDIEVTATKFSLTLTPKDTSQAISSSASKFTLETTMKSTTYDFSVAGGKFTLAVTFANTSTNLETDVAVDATKFTLSITPKDTSQDISYDADKFQLSITPQTATSAYDIPVVADKFEVNVTFKDTDQDITVPVGKFTVDTQMKTLTYTGEVQEDGSRFAGFQGQALGKLFVR